jgi:hypothetical protein
MTAHNLKRASANVGTATLKSNVTVTGSGTVLSDAMVPGGTTGQRSGGVSQIRNGIEWILKAGTTYVIRLTNRSGGAVQASISAIFYEEQAH